MKHWIWYKIYTPSAPLVKEHGSSSSPIAWAIMAWIGVDGQQPTPSRRSLTAPTHEAFRTPQTFYLNIEMTIIYQPKNLSSNQT
jgi:hypothetical protein